MFQIPFHTLKPLTTAHLAQTMALLSLPSGELQQQIEAELAANPALEMADEHRCPTCRRLLQSGQGICPVCSRPTQSVEDTPIVFISSREVTSGFSEPRDDEGEKDEDGSSVGEDLTTYVFRQIAPDINPDDRRMAAYLLTHLNEDGLLTIPLAEIAGYFHVPMKRVETIQRIIQRADPLGVGSISPNEAMLVQLDILNETNPVPVLARQILLNGMDLLSRRQFVELARRLRAPVDQVREAAHFVSENLNPFPGRSYWGDVRQPSSSSTQVYYKPDIIVSQLAENLGSGLVVEILFPVWGTLRVNPLYRQVIQQADDEQKQAMREDMDRATLFVKCLQQRNHTMQRLLQRLVTVQKTFILKGEKHLRPLTRASLSKELGVHESTISRAVANKAVQLPNGRIIPLADFFDRSLSARIALKELISSEPRPLSDSELVHLMAERGFSVARRTVAKYRAMEGILPAGLRRPCT
jgi:RNA polymerase sigma-54 factor